MRPEGKGLLVKAVDFESGRKTAALADYLIAETLFDPGVVEVGYRNGLRYSISLIEQSARDGRPGMVLGPETVFLVTGAAGGITSAIVTDLAAASRGIFYLLDLVPCPPRDDAYVQLFRTDKEALKHRLIEEARTRGEKPTPKQIDQQILAIERSEAALRAVEAVEAAGGTVHYVALDLRDGEAVGRVIEDVRRRYGRLDVVLHAGGLLIDRTLPNKEPQQFDLVFDVKADGFYHLLRAARGMPIGATVVFSSVAGRFGNNGQTDYAAANDLLCKITSWLRRRRPETRAIAIDWTAWGQIGMAARGSIPQIMEALGVDMLPPEAGVPTIRRELTCGGTRGEIVVAGRLGAWLEERDPTGGLDPTKATAALATRSPRLLMVGAVTTAGLYDGLHVETTLDPRQQPFLFDHMPDPDTPWLPGVMATEALAEVASLLAPGYRVLAVENEEMLGAFKFFRMEPRTLYLHAQVMPANGDELQARVVLRSVTKPTKEGLPTQVKTHFAATVRLGPAELPTPTIAFTPPVADDLPITAETIYKAFFHGPSYRVIERAGVVGSQAIGRFATALPPQTHPADVASLMAPRLVELCFQLAALWHQHTHGAVAFPLGFASLTVYRQETDAVGPLYGIVTTADDGETFDGRVVDEAGHVFVELKGYRTVARPA
jgi:NAD(P)-dependent dehydrogenase (short-subunit alcohol dehydrogenase family)